MSTLLKVKRQGLIQPQKSNPFENRRKAYSDKPLSTDPSPNNPVFTYKTRLKCCYSDCDPRKGFKSVYSLYHHLIHDHWNESTKVEKIRGVAAFVIFNNYSKIVEGLRR